MHQHVKNLSDYDLTNLSINDTSPAAVTETKSKSQRPYQHVTQAVELATVSLLNQQSNSINSAKHNQ